MRSFISLLIYVCAICLTGCASSEPAPQEAQGMEISVDFKEVHICSRISPEITVAYAPKGTKFYDVRLVENTPEERFLGGGVWPASDTGLIPEGALTRHYSGPCPKADERIAYTYVVTAMESENGQPLAVRLYKFTPER